MDVNYRVNDPRSITPPHTLFRFRPFYKSNGSPSSLNRPSAERDHVLGYYLASIYLLDGKPSKCLFQSQSFESERAKPS